ncbi:SseB family protein, partial [Roseivivax isoporae]
MTDETPLDAAHRVMTEAPEDDAARLRFYARLADSELCLMLVREAEGGTLDPEIFAVEGGRFVLAFDREDRLAAFAGRAVAYAAMPGRALAGMLAGQGVGIGLNLDAAPSAMLLPAEAVDWLANTLAEAEGTPAPAEARPVEVRPPEGLPRTLLAALDGALARAGGIASHAALAAVRYEDGGRGHLLAIVGAAPGAEGALARSVQEALVFS